VQHARAPGSIRWDEGEAEDINAYQLCLILHKTPPEIETLSIKHVEGLLATHAANEQIQAERIKKKRGKKSGK
jgi:hypothetical protein